MKIIIFAANFMSMKRITSLFIIILLMGIISCSKDDTKSQSEQLAEDVSLIEKYLTDNSLTAQKTNSGLHYIIEKAGNGTHPNINSVVKVQYKGYFLDGTEFDSGTATFSLSGVVSGWQEGIPLFKKGGRGKLFIPSYIGYGTSASGSVPANSVLAFDIYLISFQ